MKQSAATVRARVDELTPRQQAFVAEYTANGGNASAAFRTACADESRSSPGVVRVMAHRMLRTPAVAARLAELRSIAAEALNTTVAELALSAHELATASLHDLAPVEVYNCRYCATGRYQYRDAGELARALDAYVKSQGTPKPLPPPTDMSPPSFGYSSRAPVNPECESCRGHGVAMVRIVPTTELGNGARLLVAGVQLNEDGTVARYLIEDRAKWAHMRNQMIGAYAPTKTESKSFNVNYNLNAPTSEQPPMSAEDAIAKLRAIGALAPDVADSTSVVSEQ